MRLIQLGEKLGQQPKKRVWTVAAVLAAGVTVLGGTQIAASHHSATVTLDGKAHHVSFFGQDVSDALSAAGVQPGPHDQIVPALESPIFDGSNITVTSAHEYQVEIDGQPRTVWSTGSSSNQILNDLAARGSNVTIAASRSYNRQPLSVLALVPTNATINVDGQQIDTKVQPGQTLTQLLEASNIQVSPIDRVKATKNDGKLVINVVRVQRGNVVTETEIPFNTVKKDDPKLLKGKTKVENPGQVGKRTIVTYKEIVGGQETVSAQISDQITVQPQDRVELNGTKEPAPEPQLPTAGGSSRGADPAPSGPVVAPATGSPKAAARSMLAARGMGDDQFQCLVKLWNRESGWNPTLRNPSSGAYGIPQAVPGSKMASAGADWRTNPVTQVKWGLGYIWGRYGTPCAALGHSNAKNWY